MDTTAILDALRARRDSINEAIAALESLGGALAARRGRKPGPRKGRKRGPMSAETKRLIAAKLKAAWARRKKA